MKQADLIWMNGEFVAWEDAKVHVLTHGLHYGTGVFEGIRAYETELGTAVFRHRDHLQALRPRESVRVRQPREPLSGIAQQLRHPGETRDHVGHLVLGSGWLRPPLRAYRGRRRPMAFAVPRPGGGYLAERDRLLVGALIEARSCERFKLLSERLADPDYPYAD